jgi:sugar phosphate isomerase/epimerase
MLLCRSADLSGRLALDAAGRVEHGGSMQTRRDVLKLAAGGIGVSRLMSSKPNSVVRGVVIGAQSYSFRDRQLDQAIAAMTSVGLSYCELWQGHVEPEKASRKALREWRENIAIEQFQVVREQFSKAGVKLYAYNYSFQDDYSDREVERGFEMAKALGVKFITASANVDMAKRINGYAAQQDILVAMHNHDSMKPNEFSTPDDFARAMQGNSHIRINLDIGHFTAANFDPVDYVEKMWSHIVALHIKDRKKAHGDVVPFGQGDTPIRQVLQLLAAKQLKIPAMIEYEYAGQDPVAEVRKCYDFCRQAVTDVSS